MTTERERLIELVLPELGCDFHRPDYGACAACGPTAERVAEALTEAGYRLTDKCEACDGSGLYPNPTGVFYAPTEWLGCPDCRGDGRLIRDAEGGGNG